MSILRFENVSREDGNTVLIDDISFTIDRGQCMSIKCTEEMSLTMMNMITSKIMPTKGEIIIDEKSPEDYFKKNNKNIGVIYKEEGFYDRLTVNDYLTFFNRLFNYKQKMKDVLTRFALLDIADSRINSLSYSEKKRISLARALINKPDLLLIQEPTLNLDRQSSRIIRENIVHMKSIGISILAFSVTLEDTILIDGDSYILNEKGLNIIENELENQKENDTDNDSITQIDISNENDETELPNIKIEKIPTKIDDKIILFNPMEIDYIETIDGSCYLNVGTEKFQCSLTLSSLEKRLKHIGFFRCHRSYLVNLQRVREVITWTRNSYSLILDDKNKSSIPLSKGRMEELKQILNI
ncbi:ABC transporter [Vallitalea longa]|uniref:ABC transporter n=1 Tax=Vallitalea longa TaxID=2936439 RepID=A0A9W5Y9H8_9FIRM|nr:LytTR family transcriptional regulator DNA-binding domain-containing protein [Vallitalea longa]GKX28268.1 ABC transporter [Vallitalea longa]